MTSHYCINDGLSYWSICTSLDLNELSFTSPFKQTLFFFMKGSKLALRIPSWFCNCNSCLGAGRRDFKGDLLLWNCCYQFRCMSALIEYFVQPKWRWILVLMWNHVRKLVMLKWCCLRLRMCEISVLRVLCYTMHIMWRIMLCIHLNISLRTKFYHHGECWRTEGCELCWNIALSFTQWLQCWKWIPQHKKKICELNG